MLEKKKIKKEEGVVCAYFLVHVFLGGHGLGILLVKKKVLLSNSHHHLHTFRGTHVATIKGGEWERK